MESSYADLQKKLEETEQKLGQLQQLREVTDLIVYQEARGYFEKETKRVNKEFTDLEKQYKQAMKELMQYRQLGRFALRIAFTIQGFMNKLGGLKKKLRSSPSPTKV